MAFSPAGRGVLSEINVTPLVDVMLVLLVIFMVTAQMLDQHVDVTLPKTEAVRNLTQLEEDKVLRVEADGTLRFGGLALPADTLPFNARIKNADELYILADGDVKYRLLAQLMAKLQNAGVKRLAFVTQPEAPPDSRKRTP